MAINPRIVLLGALGLAALGADLVFSHQREVPNAELKSEPIAETRTAALQRDSAFTVINAGFRQLEPVFRRACFDCHSDQTVFPWYHRVPGVKSWLDRDIRKARKHLDMSAGFPFVGHGNPAEDLADIREELEEGSMPPLAYRLMHPGAAPTPAEKDSIYAWIDRSLVLLGKAGLGGEAVEESEDLHEGH